MLDIKIKTKLARAIKDNAFFRNNIENAFKDSADLVVLPAYKREVPIDKGFLRNNVKSIRVNPLKYTVTTTATARGVKYPMILHAGTGIYRGAGDFGKKNYIRSGESSKGGIKPNKFADRAFQQTETPVIRFIGVSLRKLLDAS